MLALATDQCAELYCPAVRCLSPHVKYLHGLMQ